MATFVASFSTSAEPEWFLFDLAAGDGEGAVEDDGAEVPRALEAGPRFFMPLLGPGRRGGGMVNLRYDPRGPPELDVPQDLENHDHEEQVACSLLLTVTPCSLVVFI